MALIRLPAGEQRSGRSGGIVYSHNRGGPYMRTANIPVNPNTDRQSAVRGYLSSLSTNWYDGLTQGQRDAWDNWADNVPRTNRLGMSIIATGQNAYVGLNAPRLQAGLDTVDDPPAVFYDAPQLSGLAIEGSAASQELTITWSGFFTFEDQDGAGALISLGKPVSATRKYFSSPYRYAGVLAGDSGTPISSPQTLGTLPWSLVEGQRLWAKVRLTLADGRLGGWRLVNFLCGA